MIIDVFISFSADQIYNIFDILFTIHDYITNSWSLSGQLPDDLVAQSVEHCTGIADVMGSNPVQA